MRQELAQHAVVGMRRRAPRMRVIFDVRPERDVSRPRRKRGVGHGRQRGRSHLHDGKRQEQHTLEEAPGPHHGGMYT